MLSVGGAEMDEELRAYLQGMESRIREYVDRRSETTESRMREYTDQRSEIIETRLLRAFRNFSHPVEARLRVQKTTTRAFNERLDAIEDRVEFLEQQGSNGTASLPDSDT
jgi:hypothetical protein